MNVGGAIGTAGALVGLPGAGAAVVGFAGIGATVGFVAGRAVGIGAAVASGGIERGATGVTPRGVNGVAEAKIGCAGAGEPVATVGMTVAGAWAGAVAVKNSPATQPSRP